MNPLLSELKKHADKKRAEVSARFFKTEKGSYGHGDIFLGLSVPQIRIVVKKFSGKLSLRELEISLSSPYHEERLAAVLLLVDAYKKTSDKKNIYEFYLTHAENINNWDLVDSSAPHIVGAYLFDKDKSFLKTLAKSQNLWKKRIAIIATQYFIRNGLITPTLDISELLLADSHDLIHKAVGWMLREAWKVDDKRVEDFIRTHYSNMPRTALRYAIERMPDKQRKQWLLGKFV